MSPLADAVRFVDDNGPHVPSFSSCQKHRVRQSLGAEVQKLRVAESNVVKHAIPVVAHPCLCPNASGPQTFALIFHQGNEWRDLKAKSTSGKGGQLETQALSTAGRHQGQGVPRSATRALAHIDAAQAPKPQWV